MITKDKLQKRLDEHTRVNGNAMSVAIVPDEAMQELLTQIGEETVLFAESTYQKKDSDDAHHVSGEVFVLTSSRVIEVSSHNHAAPSEMLNRQGFPLTISVTVRRVGAVVGAKLKVTAYSDVLIPTKLKLRFEHGGPLTIPLNPSTAPVAATGEALRDIFSSFTAAI